MWHVLDWQMMKTKRQYGTEIVQLTWVLLQSSTITHQTNAKKMLWQNQMKNKISTFVSELFCKMLKFYF